VKEQTKAEEQRPELTPHDRYFRHVFTQPEPMRDLVVNAVAPALGAVGDGASDPIVEMEPSSESFVDEELREHRTDLLVVLRPYTTLFRSVYLLFEHKAQNERHTIFQLMRYHAAVLEHLSQKGDAKVGERNGNKSRVPPPVVSVVVYNGPGRWSAPTELETALGLSGEAALRMNSFAHFRYLLFDVELGMSERYVGGPVSRTALQAMYASSRKLGKKGVLELVRSLGKPELPPEFRRATLRYLENGREDNTNELLAALKKEGYTGVGETMISWAEARRQEGHKQGIEQGLNEGLVTALLRQVERKFSVTEAERERIRAVSDPEKLQTALDEIIEPDATVQSVLERLE